GAPERRGALAPPPRRLDGAHREPPWPRKGCGPTSSRKHLLRPRPRCRRAEEPPAIVPPAYGSMESCSTQPVITSLLRRNHDPNRASLVQLLTACEGEGSGEGNEDAAHFVTFVFQKPYRPVGANHEARFWFGVVGF